MKLCFILSVLVSFGLSAKVHEIKMLNKGPSGDKMIFSPDYVKAAVGDSVKFIPVDRGHLVASFGKKGSMPKGAKKFKSKMNKEITVKLDKEGLYVVKCTPHYAMGMVALLQAGKAKNLNDIKKLKFRGKAKKRMKKIIAKVK